MSEIHTEYFDIYDAVGRVSSSLVRPHSIIVVNNKSNESIHVDDDLIGMMSSPRLGKDTFRSIIFIGCENCSIEIPTKMIKVIVQNCRNCQVHIIPNIISAVEFIRCRNVILHMERDVPIVQLDICENIHIEQTTDNHVYIMTSCYKIFIDRQNKTYEIVCGLFDAQKFVSCDGNGIKQLQSSMALNSIEQFFTVTSKDMKEFMK